MQNELLRVRIVVFQFWPNFHCSLPKHWGWAFLVPSKCSEPNFEDLFFLFALSSQFASSYDFIFMMKYNATNSLHWRSDKFFIPQKSHRIPLSIYADRQNEFLGVDEVKSPSSDPILTAVYTMVLRLPIFTTIWFFETKSWRSFSLCLSSFIILLSIKLIRQVFCIDFQISYGASKRVIAFRLQSGERAKRAPWS